MKKKTRHAMVQTGSTQRRLWRVVIIVCLLLVTSCMFKELKEEIQEEQTSYRMYGRIGGVNHAEVDVLVLLYTQTDSGLQLDRYVLPDDTGTYVFMVHPGTYVVAGFEDQNNNQRYDSGEPAGTWGKPDNIVIVQGPKTETQKNNLADLDFRLTQDRFLLEDAVTSVREVKMSATMLKLGQLSSWDDPAFDPDNGSTGYWKPVTFLKQIGVGVYFMEPYDPNKIPILFVHGAVGTPSGWKTMAESLDSERFQSWAYYYPSGMRLDKISTALNKIINRLHEDHGFDRIGVVAHSMGGLVARSFILKHLSEEGMGTVKMFLSFSTPWGGVKMAAKGAEQAPEAIPSWLDVSPKSTFIHDLFMDSLNPLVPHYLLFSYHGDCSLFMANNDGTIELSSQLDLRAQDDAVAVWGLDEDHGSILESKKAVEYLNKALQSAF